MAKLQKSAHIAEIAGAVGVVVSLLYVGYHVDFQKHIELAIRAGKVDIINKQD